MEVINDKEEIAIPDEITISGKYTTDGPNYYTYSTTATIPVKLFSNLGNYKSYQFLRKCTNVKRIHISKGVKNINGFCFSGNTSLEEIIVDDAHENYMSEGGVLYNKNQTTLIKMPPSNNYVYSSLKNSVSTIDSYAFAQCPLEEITFSSHIVSVGENAFLDCNNLKKVYTENLDSWLHIEFGNPTANPLYYAHNLYSIHRLNAADDGHFINLTMSQQAGSISSYAFAGAHFNSVSISGIVSSIGSQVFATGKVDSIFIGSNVTSIYSDAFANCEIDKLETHSNALWGKEVDTLNKCIVGENIKEISGWAFRYFGYNVSVVLPDSITTIGSYAFKTIKEVLVNRGTKTLLCLWGNKTDRGGSYKILNKENSEELPIPSLYLKNATQTSLTLSIKDRYDEYSYIIDDTPIINDTLVISDLYPEYELGRTLYASLDGIKQQISDYNRFSTLSLSPTINIRDKTASSVLAEGSYSSGDATVNSEEMAICTMTTTKGYDSKAYHYQYSHSVGNSYYYNCYYLVDGTNISISNYMKINGLSPSSSFYLFYTLRVNGIYGNFAYRTITPFATPNLTLTTQQPKVVSPGNVIVQAQSNLDEKEENVGFEWRRTDWTEDFPSNSGQAYLYEGTMEGYIRNLNTEKLWKYRPYYESATGTRYYGEWMGIDPTNTSYFEPTVHTYASINIEGNTANVQGYAMRGSDNTAEQGFKYWEVTASSRAMAPGTGSVPSNAQTVTANGIVMQASLTNLDYETTYCYVAFVTTTEGETFYGDMRQFTTDVNPAGIEESVADKAVAIPVAYYDLNGRRLQTPQSGLVIVRMSDGTSRKMIVK